MVHVPRIAIVGLGGLGSSVLPLLNPSAALILIDHDRVALDNLHRQRYREDEIGMLKAEAMLQRYPKRDITIHHVKIDEKNLHLVDADVVVDCADSQETKLLLNEHCIKRGIPLIYASVADRHGFVKYIVLSNGCLSCVLAGKNVPLKASDVGIMNSTVLMAASIQAELANLAITGTAPDELFSFDSWKGEMKRIIISAKPSCQICGRKDG